MKPKFELKINTVETVNELPESWSTAAYRELLTQLEFDGLEDVPEDQLRDYAVMALQDLEPADAAAALVELTIGDRLSDGRKQNLATDMPTDRCWEEYPDLSCHEAIFNAQILLNQAFPETPIPEINKVGAALSSLNQPAEQFLVDHATAIPEAVLVRCLASAAAEDSILNRLFEDPIAGADFPEAENIAWQVITESLPPEGSKRQRRSLSLYSPIRWTSDLEDDLAVECEPFIEED